MKDTRSYPCLRFFSAPLLLPLLLVSVTASAKPQQRQSHHLRRQSRLIIREDHRDSDARAAVVIPVQRHDHGVDRRRLPQKIVNYQLSREALQDKEEAGTPSPTPELQDTDEETASPTPTRTANLPHTPAPLDIPEPSPTPTRRIPTPVPTPPPETPAPIALPDTPAPVQQPTPAPVTPAPVVQPTVAPPQTVPTPGPTMRTPAPSTSKDQDEVEMPAPLEGNGSAGTSAPQDNDGIENKV